AHRVPSIMFAEGCGEGASSIRSLRAEPSPSSNSSPRHSFYNQSPRLFVKELIEQAMHRSPQFAGRAFVVKSVAARIVVMRLGEAVLDSPRKARAGSPLSQLAFLRSRWRLPSTARSGHRRHA